MSKLRLLALASLTIFGAVLMNSCKEEEEPIPDPIASFQYEVSSTNFLEFTFTNFSQNASSYSWDFGDGSAASTVESPTHIFEATGSYTVTLTATNSEGTTSEKSETVSVTDPDAALTLLAGLDSKEWKLFREGVALQVGPSAADPQSWYALVNEGARPCLYDDVVTFHRDGTFNFDDAGTFWGEYGIWGTSSAENALFETCFEPTAGNMTIDGIDVSAWGSGTHQFEYNSTSGDLTLVGSGAWLAVPNLGTDAPHAIDAFPATKTVPISISEENGYDLMTVTFDHGVNGVDGGSGFRKAIYVSYDNWADEPVLVEGAGPCELAEITPSSMSHTFETASSFVELGALGGATTITTGVDDPTDAAATKVGQLDRVATNDYQEATFRVSPELKDFNLTNLTTVSLEVFIPSATDFSGALTNTITLGFADQSCVEQWWTAVNTYTANDVATGTWETLTFEIPSAPEGDPTSRTGLDMFYISFGGGGHFVPATIYIRNLSIQ